VAYVALANIQCAGIVHALVNLFKRDWAPIVIVLLTVCPCRDGEQAAVTARSA